MGFFRELKKKTEPKTDRGFDSRFWAKFQREFDGEEKPVFGAGFASRFWRWASPVAVAASLALVVVYGWGFRAARVIEDQENAQIVADQDLIENYELLAALDDTSLADLGDDDWALLLAEGGNEN